MMKLTCLILAVLVVCSSAMFPPGNGNGQMCGSVSCPMGYQCVRDLNNGGGMYGNGKCAVLQFQCPYMNGGNMNMYGFKRCNGGIGGGNGGIGGGIGGGNGGIGGGNGNGYGCNYQRGEQCCNGVCMTGPALVSSYMGGPYSGAEKDAQAAAAVAPTKPKEA